MFQKIFLSFVLVLGSGCSLLSQKEYVSVDSYPRGAKVKRIKNKKVKDLGTSPVFDKIRSSDEVTYQFEYMTSDGEHRLTKPVPREEKCGVTWRDPLVDKIPFMRELIPDFFFEIMADYNPLNFVRGGKFECTSLVRTKFSDMKKSNEPKQCKKYLIIPPPHKYNRVSKKLMKHYEKKIFNKNKKGCDKLISPKVSEEYLNYMGFDHLERKYGMRFLLFGRVADLGYKLKATHVVFLHHEYVDNKFKVSPEVFDIHSRLRTDKHLEEKYEAKIPFTRGKIFLDRLGNAFRFIPNSVFLKFRFRQFLNLKPESAENDFESKISKTTIPPSIRITNIENPLQPWGVNFRFSPSFTYKKWEQQYRIKFLLGVMAFKFYGHTPIGSFMGRFGFGAARVSAKNLSSDYEDSKGQGAFQWGFEYYKFIHHRFFLNLGYRRNQFVGNKIKDGPFHLRGYSSVFFSLGYFTPELKTVIRDLFY